MGGISEQGVDIAARLGHNALSNGWQRQRQLKQTAFGDWGFCFNCFI